MEGSCSQGYKPTQLTVSQLTWESIIWLPQTDSALGQPLQSMLFQTDMTSILYQWNTEVHLPHL